MDNETERRKAENEAIFRQANEKIRDARVELLETHGPTPFLCECSQPDCREIVLVDLAAYELVRSDPKRFILAVPHSTGDSDIVQACDGYVIVAKDGVAGQVAEATDPRA